MTTRKQNHGYEHKSTSDAMLHTSIRERYCLTKFFDALNKKAGFKKYECAESPAYKACSYDATLKIYNKEQEMIGYSLIEVKVREELHKDYFFEKRKKEALYKAKEQKDLLLKEHNLECGILYINFMWNGTLLWDVLELEDKGYFKRGKRHMMNKKTVESRENKVLKSVYHLQTEDAKFFTDFFFSNKQFLAWYEEASKPKQEMQPTKTIISLF